MFGDLLLRARPSAIVVGLAAVALGAGQLAPLTQTANATTTPSTHTHQRAGLSWAPCRDGFECATVHVPLDYDRRDGVKVSLSVVRMPAARPSARIGSLLINPGGPGGSGVDVVRAIAPFLPLTLRARFDIVGLDPRGVIGSTPLRCFKTFEEAVAVLPPFAFPVTSRQENVQRIADRTLATACARHGGPIVGHMSTADVARDMDVLRDAMGDRRLNYLGFSYGSFLGQTYANLFPHRIRAMAIDGVIDPVAWTTGRGDGRAVPFSTRLGSDQGAQRTLNQFFRLCDRALGDCAFSDHARRRYAHLARRLRHHPLTVRDPSGAFQFTYADLIGTTLGAMYAPVTWPDLAVFLASIQAQKSPTTAGRALSAVRAGLGLAEAPQEEYPNYVEGRPGVACSDSVNPDSFSAWRNTADKAERRHGYFGRPWTWVSSICLPWPSRAGQDRYLGPWTARTSSPVLVVGNYFDPATRYRGAVTAARLLANSRLLSYAGWGHTAFLSGNYCIDSKVTRYLASTRVPAPGTICRPAGSPFGPTSALTRTRAQAAATAVMARLPEAVRQAVSHD